MNLDDSLMTEAKKLAAETGRTLTEIVSDALRERLARTAAGRESRPNLPVFHGSGLMPGVDVSSNAALLELMENQRDPG
ncbi:MAG TPA: type II toxin-antitoxin system VapB family antitoxin [Bryobacteraceae bacterium]|nr:type II toxin-antitoxin system VapB family antitoxin [Bryobacteraceae bacterium]HPT27916.1 type II toxin-antitoxin system VapB family antitoxin [Bryobacteraceae bacterium]